MKRNGFSLALINPRMASSFWTGLYNQSVRNHKFIFYPLSLATVAGIFSRCGIRDIRIVDENIGHDYRDAERFDVVGVTGFPNQRKRIRELGDYFKRLGKHTLLGGPFATVWTAEAEDRFDTIFAGDSEALIPRFCRDYRKGKPAALYRYDEHDPENGFVSPRLDLLEPGRYTFATLQTTRGCPHSCEFCAIRLHSGTRVKLKPVRQVIRELETIHRLKGSSSVFLADDNSASDFIYFKRLLEAIIRFQETRGYPFRFGTQITVLIARDEALLELMARAGFYEVFLGLESPSRDCLEETGKHFQANMKLAQAVRKIYSFGITVDSGAILGFDHDDAESFERHFRFFQSIPIPFIYSSLLYATPGTVLYERLSKSGRIQGDSFQMGSNQGSLESALTTNVVPLNLSPEELSDGYRRLMGKLYCFPHFEKRLLGYLRHPVRFNNERWVSPRRSHDARVIATLARITVFYLVEDFPASLRLYLKAVFRGLCTRRAYIAFHHLVHFKQAYTYHMKIVHGPGFTTRFERFGPRLRRFLPTLLSRQKNISIRKEKK